MDTRSESLATAAAADPEVETMKFGTLDIAFDRRVLRPRSWTTAQSYWAADLMRSAPDGDVLELCAGAGHIGLLAVAGNQRCLVAVDLDAVAAAFAKDNAAAAGLTSRVEVREGPMDHVLGTDERFAVVIADPPWVGHEETDRFPEDPLLAIDGGEDGLDLARTCVSVIEAHLAPGGSALLQLGSVGQVDRLVEGFDPNTGLRLNETRGYADKGVLVRLDRLP